MREFKFRAWDRKRKLMFDSNNDNFHIAKHYSDGSFHGYVSTDKKGEQREVELMQFTGLKDKNGKEIYEGDMLHWKTVNDDYKFVVEYGGLDDMGQGMGIGFNVHESSVDILEVIGNIYENPELLKEE